MYRLVFDGNQTIEFEDIKDLDIQLVRYDGTNPPKFMRLCIKKNLVDQNKSLYEAIFWHRKLQGITILAKDDEGNDQLVSNLIKAPDKFHNLFYEDGMMVIDYGDPLYSDEVW